MSSYNNAEQQLALLSDSAASSQRLFCLLNQIEVPTYIYLTSFELFLSLIAQSVQNIFYRMNSHYAQYYQ